MRALGLLVGVLLAFGTGCWTHTAMDLPIAAPVGNPSIGKASRILVAIQPEYSHEPGGNQIQDAPFACQNRGGTFEKMLCESFVAQLKAAGFAGQAICRIGPPPAGWQRSYDYLYDQRFEMDFTYRSSKAIAIYLLTLTSVLHKRFDIRITSKGTLISARGDKATVLQNEKHEFYVGTFGGIIPVIWNGSKVRGEVLLCAEE